jgi:TonB family protein
VENEVQVRSESAIEQSVTRENTKVLSDIENFAPEIISPSLVEKPRGNELWTSLLIVLVIGTAVLLGVAIGWHGAAKGVNSATPASKLMPSTVSANSNPSAVSQSATAVPESTQPANMNGSLNPEVKPATPVSSSLATGGLVVTQNGKVIYRSVPQNANSTPAVGAAVNAGARLIHRVAPEYPAEAREQNLQGTVVLVVDIESDGTVGEIGVASGDPILAGAAMKAVKQWRYQPYSVNGQPVERQTRISIKFTLPPS